MRCALSAQSAASVFLLLAVLLLAGCPDDPPDPQGQEFTDTPTDAHVDSPGEVTDGVGTDATSDTLHDAADSTTDVVDSTSDTADLGDGGLEMAEEVSVDIAELDTDTGTDGGETPELVFRSVGFGVVASASVSDSFVITGRVGSATTSSTSTSWVISGGF